MKWDSDKEVIKSQESLADIGIAVLLAAERRYQDSLDALPGVGLIDEPGDTSLNFFTLCVYGVQVKFSDLLKWCYY